MVRFSLSDSVRKDIVFSGLRLIPLSQKGDILVPPYKGVEQTHEAINFLRLWSLWAIGVGFSTDLTKKILERYIKVTFHLKSYATHATWDDLVDTYYDNHRLSGADEFKHWYRSTVEKARVLITWYSYIELAVATDCFSSANWLGRGFEGEVFRGRYGDIGDVAVKCFKSLPGESLTRVLSEVALHREMGRDSFPNIVHVLGYSTGPECPLLVFEFMNNGNLRHHLEGVYGTYLLQHPRVRLSIAIDIANALVQLHYKGRWPIYHRDVRSTNILLDSNWKAKLSDLGLALTIRSEADRKTPSVAYSQGYEDPVYVQTGVVDDKSDVWSFGVVLMELVTFLKVWDSQRKPERLLSDLVISRARSGNWYTLMRFPGRRDNQASDVLEKMMDVALRCCDKDMKKRPSIASVAKDLQAFRSHSLPRKKWVLECQTSSSPAAGEVRPRSAPVDKGCIGWKWQLEPYSNPLLPS
ncbi:hypothetical protein R1sor_006852 [Riccia sorocarpa]|uniref:Protein kinase domain-containing protein n=1 Tax=Riccia sorocarpa TaxID=122646 RepID=A0ABD3HQW3_9MARC